MHVCVPKLTQWLANPPNSQYLKEWVATVTCPHSVTLGTAIINFFQLGSLCNLQVAFSQ